MVSVTVAPGRASVVLLVVSPIVTHPHRTMQVQTGHAPDWPSAQSDHAACTVTTASGRSQNQLGS